MRASDCVKVDDVLVFPVVFPSAAVEVIAGGSLAIAGGQGWVCCIRVSMSQLLVALVGSFVPPWGFPLPAAVDLYSGELATPPPWSRVQGKGVSEFVVWCWTSGYRWFGQRRAASPGTDASGEGPRRRRLDLMASDITHLLGPRGSVAWAEWTGSR